LAKSKEKNKKKRKEKEEEEEKNFETSNRQVDCNPEKRTSCGIFREKEKDLEEEAGGTEVSVGNIGNGRTTDVSPKKTKTKENKEYIYERRDIDDSGQIHGRANGRKVCRRDLRRIEGGVTSICNSQKRARRVESDNRSQLR
jgi:outer membrane biosynthesis protein TonB